jgi:hypothetical protein
LLANVSTRWATALLILVVGQSLHAQSVRTATTILIGRVVTAEGMPIAGASISGGDAEGVASVFVRAAADGTFRLALPAGIRSAALTARQPGYVAQSRRIGILEADSLVPVPEFRLATSQTTLAVVRTTARRSPPSRVIVFRAPGDNSVVVDAASSFSAELTGDLTGDLALNLGAVQGITITPGSGGDLPSFSLSGLGSEQNRLTMNGTDYGGSPPRDGGAIRISTSSYDVGQSESGAHTDWLMLGGAGIPKRRVHVTLDTPTLQWTTPLGERLGQRTSYPVVSGEISSFTKGYIRAAAVAFQGSRRTNDVITLDRADALTLEALRVSRDSVDRLMASLGPLGLPGSIAESPRRVTTTGSLYARLDFTRPNDLYMTPNVYGRPALSGGDGFDHMLYAIVGGDWSQITGSSVGPSTLFTAASQSTRASAFVRAFNSVYWRDVFLNETRSAFLVGRNQSGPDSELPAASVLLSSATVDGSTSLASVQVGGSGAASSESRNWSWQTTNETRWPFANENHEAKLALEATFDGISTDRTPGAGAFTFSSLADFAASQPASFSRTITGTSSDLSGLHGAIGLSDAWKPSRAFGMQYGVRAEAHHLSGGPERNAAIDSAFGVTTGRFPTLASLSPMVGFTWQYGSKSARGDPAAYPVLTGGVRDYRGLVRTQAFEPYALTTGMSGATQQVLCVGNAAPYPSWTDFQQSSSAIPDRCADGTVGSPFVQSAPSVRVIAPDYAPSHSWRSDLTWSNRIGPATVVSLHGTGALNANQDAWSDLNFSGVTQFSLANERGRPVFVRESSIVPPTGVMTLSESRVLPGFAQVIERRSDDRTRAGSLTAALDYSPPITFISSGVKVPISVAYTLSDVRSQQNGFAGTTAGDPRTMTWDAGTFSRHVLSFSTLARHADWGELRLGVQMRSGLRYTPVVSGDINGDGGRSNDRAFVFDPVATKDTAVAKGMSQLLSSVSGSTRDCLQSQLGRIANQNSCSGPWSASMNASVVLNTARFRLQNRGQVRLQFTNILAGIDQLVNGASAIHGWGQYAYPDATLLSVRGFDAAGPQFTYTVNPLFGSTTGLRNLNLTPFRISIDVRLDIGPDQERRRMIDYLAPVSNGAASGDSTRIFHRLIGQRMSLTTSVVAVKDSLGLSPSIVDSLIAMGNAHTALRERLYGSLAALLVARAGDYDHQEVQAAWRAAIESIRQSEGRIIAAAQAMLTSEQAAALVRVATAQGPFGGNNLARFTRRQDERELDRELARWFYGPP